MRCLREEAGTAFRPHRNLDTFSAERGDFEESGRCMMSLDEGNSSMLAKTFGNLYRESTELRLDIFFERII
jgi:hypothetical protein